MKSKIHMFLLASVIALIIVAINRLSGNSPDMVEGAKAKVPAGTFVSEKDYSYIININQVDKLNDRIDSINAAIRELQKEKETYQYEIDSLMTRISKKYKFLKK